MKVSTDQRGINVTWKPGTTLRVVKQLTRKRTLAGAIVAIFLYVVFGQWLVLTVATVAVLTVLATLTVVAVETRKIKKAAAPKVRQRRHIGELYLSELPGFVWILLAGPEYRRHAAGILERRAEAGRDVPWGNVAANLRVLAENRTGPQRHPRWICGYCAARRTHDPGGHRRGTCDEQRVP